MDYSLPGSSVHEIFQARMLAWVVISYSNNEVKDLEKEKRDFAGGPVAKIPYSQCRGPGFDPWSGN